LRFEFWLADRFHMLHSDMMNRMTIREFDDWTAFHSLQMEAEPESEGLQRPPEHYLNMFARHNKTVNAEQ